MNSRRQHQSELAGMCRSAKRKVVAVVALTLGLPTVFTGCSGGSPSATAPVQAHAIATRVQLQHSDLPSDWHRFGPRPYPTPESKRLPAVAACMGIRNPWTHSPLAEANVLYLDSIGREFASSRTVVLETTNEEQTSFAGYSRPNYERCYLKAFEPLLASQWTNDGKRLAGLTAEPGVVPPGLNKTDALAFQLSESVTNPDGSAPTTRFTEDLLMRHESADTLLSVSIGYGQFPTDLFDRLALILYDRLTGRPVPSAPNAGLQVRLYQAQRPDIFAGRQLTAPWLTRPEATSAT